MVGLGMDFKLLIQKEKMGKLYRLSHFYKGQIICTLLIF
jgi:hypothetical protein